MIEIVMPQFGETAEEQIVIVKWRRSPGDSVRAGEILLEIETEKSALEVEAVCSGVLTTIVRHEGERVKPGEVIGYINVH
jgi:pyruvate/2-oxoglutarate dehydrogenase complex dihydrolipoamide acyltransferase (E2) component